MSIIRAFASGLSLRTVAAGRSAAGQSTKSVHPIFTIGREKGRLDRGQWKRQIGRVGSQSCLRAASIAPTRELPIHACTVGQDKDMAVGIFRTCPTRRGNPMHFQSPRSERSQSPVSPPVSFAGI